MNYDPSMLAHCLPDYYKLLFPFKPFCKWLCYGQKPSAYFSYREFAFIFEGDVHIRYRSFNDMLEFEKELCKSSPFKLDIGAIYNHKPKDNKKFSDFRAEQRELVFDIDLTDYDEIRKCCSGANVCKKCCRWITIAMKVLDRLLKEHFGFKHRLWVFSGRRGVHCWVADAEARKLTNPGRAAVASYLSLISGQQNIVNVSEKKGFVHPVISDAYQFIMETGEVDRMVVEQGWLSGEEGLSALTEGCKDDNVINELKSIINDVMRIDSIEQQWLALRIKLDSVKRKEMMAQKGVELCKVSCIVL
ncbi:unnamed protein product [Anisakis simplex]|uniref:DNA primase n=1 Tax=Anisakis simplex TaxID=6269 RepID=A0A0M3IYG1_ANISI|nr:unnamed protein product [Anisakis simplex]